MYGNLVWRSLDGFYRILEWRPSYSQAYFRLEMYTLSGQWRLVEKANLIGKTHDERHQLLKQKMIECDPPPPVMQERVEMTWKRLEELARKNDVD